MKNIRLVFTGYKFPVAEEIARRFESQCSSENFVLKQSFSGFEKSKCFEEDKITFDFDVEVEGKKQCSFHFEDALNYNFSKMNDTLSKYKWPFDKFPKGGIVTNFITEGGEESIIRIKKPEIGLIPEKFWNKQRLKSINEAIERYNKNQQIIPVEWIHERNELLEKIHGNKAAT